MTKLWRLILDEKNDGYLNMATDEAIYRCYQKQSIPTLRVYGWNAPTISIGYTQDLKETLTSTASIPFVRRLTGGQCILHDGEVTYSISCSRKDLDLPRDVKTSYKILCQFLNTFYRKLGLEARFAGEVYPHDLGRREPYCYSSYEEFDLVIMDKKIGGNAQRRNGNFIFQHGSIPQTIDFNAIKACIRKTADLERQATSLDILLSRVTRFTELRELLHESFKETFAITFQNMLLSDQELVLRDTLLKEKYLTGPWNYSRSVIRSCGESRACV